MPERRHAYVDRVAGLGLSPPDDHTMHGLWQIVDEGVLGASRHLRLTLELLRHQMETATDPETGWRRAVCTAGFIAETRGRQAPTIANGIRRLLHGLEAEPAAARGPALARRIEDWSAAAERSREALVGHAVATIGPGRRVIVFDYSSTVAAIVTRLARAAPPEEVIVPESRAIAGGRPYLEAFAAAGMAVRYVVDAAFDHILAGRAVVLLGAERLWPDGSLVNTIGSRPLARLARWRGCPVHGCADLLKLDSGGFVEPELREFPHLLDGIELPPQARVSTATPELEVVPAELLTAIITERGPVAPAGLARLAAESGEAGR